MAMREQLHENAFEGTNVMPDSPQNHEPESVELLVSCMGLKDLRILELANVQSDVLIVDQCGENGLTEHNFRGHAVRHMRCDERGLSRSRNRAIENAQGTFGLICDDDETLVDGYPAVITRAYRDLPDADIICFRLENRPRNLKPKVQRINPLSALSIASCQISMRMSSVQRAGVRFDTLMGAGSGNGAGEETKFVRDCLRAGLTIYYVPENIGLVAAYQLDSDKADESTWFTGINDMYFYQRGATTRYMLGAPLATAYALYYVPTHRAFIEQSMSRVEAFRHIMRGVRDNPIGKQARKG